VFNSEQIELSQIKPTKEFFATFEIESTNVRDFARKRWPLRGSVQVVFVVTSPFEKGGFRGISIGLKFSLAPLS